MNTTVQPDFRNSDIDPQTDGNQDVPDNALPFIAWPEIFVLRQRF